VARHSKRIAGGGVVVVLSVWCAGCPGIFGRPPDCSELDTTTRDEARTACSFIADEDFDLTFEVVRWDSIQQVNGEAACPRDAQLDAETESCTDDPEGQTVDACIACRTAMVNAVFTEDPCSFDTLPADVLAACPSSLDDFSDGASCRLAIAYTGIAALVDAGLTREEVLIFNPMQCQPLGNFEACFECTIAMVDRWFGP